MLAATFVLGLLLGGSGLPYVESRVPLVGFLIAVVVFFTHLPSAIVTARDFSGVVLLPVAALIFWPLFSAAGGATATAGVLLHRGTRHLLRRTRSA